MRTFARWLLAANMVFAGVSHLFWARKEFQAQVPDWTVERTPLDKDQVVLASGVAEIALGTALAAAPASLRPRVGTVLALFFAAVFPGNWSQYTHRRDGFGLDTDVKRLVRLFFQPVLMAWAFWSTRR
ncbi:DoxX family protein [Microbacterium sp. GXF7504]